MSAESSPELLIKSAPPKDLGYSLRIMENGLHTLSITMNATPTQKHFDPERINMDLVRGVRIEKVSIGNNIPYKQAKSQVGIGLVTLADRIGKKVSFFTFGGLMEQEGKDTEPKRIYRITSPAPIIQSTADTLSPESLLVSQTLALLARLKAGYRTEDLWQKKLAAVEPYQLYSAILNSFLNQYNAQPKLKNMHPDFYRMIKERARTSNLDVTAEYLLAGENSTAR